MFDSIPVPGRAEDPATADLRSEIRTWVDSEPMAALLRRFGGPVEPSASLTQRLADLETFSKGAWDFRGNKERNLISLDAVTGEVEELVLDAAQALGLVTPEPPRDLAYDHVLVLGGLVRACVWRPEYAALLLHEGLRARSFAALTGFRPLGGDEPGLLDVFGLLPRHSEHEVMTDAVVRAFGVDHLDVKRQSPPDAADNDRFLVATGSTPEGTELNVVVAPSTEPGKRRANTADTYEFWAREVAHPEPGESLLLVTSAIYVPFQHADAIRMLGLTHGCRLDTVGLDAARIDDRGVPQPFTGAHYLQEIRSAIRSFGLLEAVLPE